MDAMIYFAILNLHEAITSIVAMTTGLVALLYFVASVSNFYRDSMRSKINVQ